MSIPVLMYHEIGDNRLAHSYSVSELQFKNQLEYLYSNDYETILLEEYLQGRTNGKIRNNKKQIILTFDDAQISNYTYALPLLKQYGFKAVFFIPTNFISQDQNLLNKSHLLEMMSEGMSIQSHTHTHPFLDDLDEDQIYTELKTSKTILEEILSKEITLISCPGGRFNSNVLSISKECGYKGLCNSIPRLKPIGHDLKVLGRFLISSKTDLLTFKNIVNMNMGYLLRMRLEYTLKDTTKRILGNSIYHKFWSLVKK